MSLPGIHGTTPDYVPPDPGLFLKNSLRHGKSVEIKATDERMLKIGIAWTGNPQMKRNNERSIPFELMLQLAEIPNVVVYSLQMDSKDIEKHGAQQLVCDLSQQIKPLGFAGTSACNLDLDYYLLHSDRAYGWRSRRAMLDAVVRQSPIGFGCAIARPVSGIPTRYCFGKQNKTIGCR
jgi:hypothetical protein